MHNTFRINNYIKIDCMLHEYELKGKYDDFISIEANKFTKTN